MRSVLVAWALAAVAAADPALAQRVRGALTDSATHEPIPGAVVSISDSSGRFLARGVADAEGRFSVPRLDGSSRIHIVRIGYRPTDALVLPGDELLELHMVPIASRLATVKTSGRRVCPGETKSSEALELWEQVRAGFFASVVARQAQPPTLALHFYRLERDPVLKRIVDDTAWAKTAIADESFVAARSAASFASDGYLRERPDGEREYFAPDEAVLLDSAFAGTHCMRVAPEDRAHTNQIGLGFDPVDAEHDDVVDVRGVIWLDRKDLNLRTLDFEYTNVEKVKGGSGGSITFQLMPTGVPMIVRWMIHSPVMATESELTATGVRRSLPPRPARTRYRVLGYQETGAQVRRVTWSDGSTWTPRLPAVIGLIADQHGRLLPDIRVWLYGVSDVAITDSVGAFRFPRPFGGVYTLVAADSTLAAGGINQTLPTRILVGEDPYPTTDIDVDVVRLYPRADALRGACPAGRYVPGQGVAIVRVVDSSGTAVPGARVDVETLQNVVAGDTIARPVHRTGEAGPDGRFLVCGAALDQPMTFRASHDDAHGERGIPKWTDDVVVLTLTIRPGHP